MIFQCEPSAYADEALKAAQRAVPLAIVHGKTDPLVPFDGGAYAAGLFLDAGWPAFRLFADDDAGHMFARLPVGPAIRWLEAMASDDPRALLDFAERRWKESGRRDAIAAVRRAKDLKLDAGPARLEPWPRRSTSRPPRRPRRSSRRSAPTRTTRGSTASSPSATSSSSPTPPRERWPPSTPSGPGTTPPAQKAMGEARAFFRQGRRDEGYARAREVVEKYYASPSYRLARKWAAEQK